MEVKVNENNGKIKLKLSGDVYIEQADELTSVFNSVIEKNPKEVEIDLNGLKTITSSGIGRIVLLYKGLKKKGSLLSIIGVNDTIMQIFKVVKLNKLIKIKST